MQEQIEHPINAFPQYIQEIIYHYSEAKGYPTDFFITAFLAAASTAMGRSVTLTSGNFSVIASIWAIVVAKKGQVKSEALTDAFKPIKNRQFLYHRQFEDDMEQVEEMRSANPKKKIKDPKPAKRILLSDTTPEKLVITLSENPKGCGIIYDELSGFIRRFDRYSSGADEEMYLSLFNGDTILRDRVQGKSAYAKNSYLSIAGSTQISVLKSVFNGKSENGFFDRWLICQPDNLVKQYPNQYGINPVEEQKYFNIIERLLSLEYDEHNYNQMSYNEKSYPIINDYQKSMIDIENSTSDDNLRGVLAKMEIYLHRFALLLQALEYSLTGDILDLYHVSEYSAKGAVILVKYFTSEAIKSRLVSPVEMLKDIWIDIYNALPDHGGEFNRNTFIKICLKFKVSEKAGDNFLKSHSEKSETKLFYKVKHGIYTKNLF